MRSTVKKIRPSDDRGASIVELALIFPVMAFLVMGVLDLGRGYQLDIRLENAAREGAAYAQLFPNSVEGCTVRRSIEDRVLDDQPTLASATGYDVQVLLEGPAGTWTDLEDCDGTAAGPGDRVRVVVHATFDVLTPMVEQAVGHTIAMSGEAAVRVQAVAR